MARGQAQESTNGLFFFSFRVCVKIMAVWTIFRSSVCLSPWLGREGMEDLAVLIEDLHSLNTLRVRRYF